MKFLKVNNVWQLKALVEMTDNLEALAPFKSSAEELLNDTDSVTLLAAALKLLTKNQIRLL